MKLIKFIKLKITHFIRESLYKNFNHYAWSRRLSCRLFDFETYYPQGLMVNLGAGPYFKRRGWISVDFIDGLEKQTNVLNINLKESLNKLPFKNVRAFYMSHTLEHFNINQGKKLLYSIHSAMESGGYLRIVVPDADLILNLVREGDLEYFKPIFSYFKMIDENKILPIDIALHLLSQPRCRLKQLLCLRSELTEFEKNLLNQDNDEIIKQLNKHNFPQNAEGVFHLAAFNEKILINALKEIGFSKVYKSAFMQSRFGPMREAPIFDGTHPWLSLYIEAIK